MAAKVVQLTLNRGDTFEQTLTFTNQDGSVKDITGSTVWFTVKLRFSDLDAAALVQVDSTGAELVITDASAGIATLQLLPATTLLLVAPCYVYDIQIKETAGRVTTPQRGALVVGDHATIKTT